MDVLLRHSGLHHTSNRRMYMYVFLFVFCFLEKNLKSIHKYAYKLKSYDRYFMSPEPKDDDPEEESDTNYNTVDLFKNVKEMSVK